MIIYYAWFEGRYYQITLKENKVTRIIAGTGGAFRQTTQDYAKSTGVALSSCCFLLFRHLAMVSPILSSAYLMLWENSFHIYKDLEPSKVQ